MVAPKTQEGQETDEATCAKASLPILHGAGIEEIWLLKQRHLGDKEVHCAVGRDRKTILQNATLGAQVEAAGTGLTRESH